jgi:hypothetical protein
MSDILVEKDEDNKDILVKQNELDEDIVNDFCALLSKTLFKYKHDYALSKIAEEKEQIKMVYESFRDNLLDDLINEANGEENDFIEELERLFDKFEKDLSSYASINFVED